MKKTGLSRLFLVLCLLVHGLFVSQARADDKLGTFEKEVSRQDDRSRGEDCHERDDSELVDDDFLGLLFSDLWVYALAGIGYGGVSSYDRTSYREDGERLIPMARLEVSYQDVESDVTAVSFDLQGGFGPVGIWGHHTRFDEDNPDATLELSYAQVLYRMSFGEAVEVDFGMGGTVLHGIGTHRGLGLSLPVRVHPWDHLGAELRPVWSFIHGNVVYDTTLGLVAGWPYVAVHAGYRWVSTGDVSLDGPVIGVVLTF